MTHTRRNTLRGFALLALLLVVLSGCGRPTPSPTPPPAVVPPFSRDELPSDEAVVEVQSDKGGTIALEDGAQATLPPGSLTQDATVTFRTAADAPAAPVPANILGQAYELVVDGSEMTGVGLLRLPLPPGVTADQYKFAPYRWTGRMWERVTAREEAGGVQFGVDRPGIFALLGEWRFADAALALVKPETLPGQLEIPLTVVGQYRYSTVPALQDELVPARLVLKQDTSGGAGLVAGNPDLDATIAETTLYFKPDPAQSNGLIEFNHLFEVLPGLLQVDPGVNTRFYVTLEVEDSAAPTRRISTGIDYTQVLPIQLQDMKVIRPVLQGEERLVLRWKIMLNGLTFQTPAARGPELALQPVIDQGGVGEYTIVLEVQNEGEWLPISNEVGVQLAVRATATPEPGQPTATPAAVAFTTPGAGIPTPALPTRRPTPAAVAQARVTPTATPTLAATSAPTVTPDPARVFWADKYIIAPGECIRLNWKVENVISVLFEGQAATGVDSREVCPTQSTTYKLQVTSGAGTQDYTVTIQVASATQAAFAFQTDKAQVRPGECAILSWNATNVKEVRLDGKGVPGIFTQQVCPEQTTTYTLTVVDAAGATTTKTATVTVSASAAMAFWAEQYTLPVGGCTTLRWRVENVQSVFLDGTGVNGVGSQQACPLNAQFYTLEVMDSAGNAVTREVVLTAAEPLLPANEVIGQGAVNSVSALLADIDPELAGDQPGYTVVVDGIRPLYVGTPGGSQSNVTIRIPQEAVDLGEGASLHWPLRPSQSVEFRAACEGATCRFDYAAEHYLYWRSE